MVITTRKQREAIKRVFDRTELAIDVATGWPHALDRVRLNRPNATAMPYRQFRRMVQSGSYCIMINWCGMWLGIESDGYTHS